jgi:hypothetical protein
MERASYRLTQRGWSCMLRTGPYGLAALLLITATGFAQTASSPIVGTWHSVAGPPDPQILLMIAPDGYYSQIAIPPGRSKPKNDWDHRTREELMKQFGGVRARYGTWKVAGNKLIRMRLASEEPGVEGTEAVAEFRIEGDVLVLKGQNNAPEGRFRRMK